MRAVLTREAIIDAAWKLLLAEGLEAVSLRRVANELDVTAPALYAHISDKEDLLTAVAAIEFDNLLSRYRDREFDDPVEELRYELHQYVDYARTRPRAFRLLFRHRSTNGDTDRELHEHPLATEAFNAALEPTKRAIENGTFRDVDPLVAGLAIWSAVHGLANALLLGIDYGDREEPMIETTIEMIIDGMRAR